MSRMPAPSRWCTPKLPSPPHSLTATARSTDDSPLPNGPCTIGASSFNRRVNSLLVVMAARVSFLTPADKYTPFGNYPHGQTRRLQRGLPFAKHPRPHRQQVVDASALRTSRRPGAHTRAEAPPERRVSQDADANTTRTGTPRHRSAARLRRDPAARRILVDAAGPLAGDTHRRHREL